MFNVYSYDIKIEENRKLDKQKNDYIKQKNRRKSLNQKLSKNYKKRVDQFLINMKEEPVIINDFKTLDLEKFNHRLDDQPEKFKGFGIFKMKSNYYDQKALKQQSLYNSSSFNKSQNNNNETKKTFRNTCLSNKKNQDNIDDKDNKDNGKHGFYQTNSLLHFQFRERDVSKEIQPDLRYTAKTTLERIKNYLENNTQTQVSNNNLQNLKLNLLSKMNNDESQKRSAYKQKMLNAREIAKQFLPELHIKTHFKATQEAYNQCPTSMKVQPEKVQTVLNKNSEQVHQISEKKSMSQIIQEEQSTKYQCLQVLQKCNYQRDLSEIKKKRQAVSEFQSQFQQSNSQTFTFK